MSTVMPGIFDTLKKAYAKGVINAFHYAEETRGIKFNNFEIVEFLQCYRSTVSRI